MNDSRQVLHEQDTQLPLNLLLQVVTHEWDGIKCRRDLERLQRVVPEDQRQALLFGEDQDNKAGEADVGQSDLQWYSQAGRCCQWLW